MPDDCSQCRALFQDYVKATAQHSQVVSELSRALDLHDLSEIKRLRNLLQGSREALMEAKDAYERHVKASHGT